MSELPAEHDELYTADEACDVLRISRSKLNRMMDAGMLQAYWLGDELRFWRSDLRKVLVPRVPKPGNPRLQRKNATTASDHIGTTR